MSSVKLMLKKMLLFLSFGLNYMNYCSILFLGVLDSCIICYCLILLVFRFVYLYLFGLNRGFKILFDLFWLPKSPLLAMPDPTLDDVVGGTGKDISRISLYSMGVLERYWILLNPVNLTISSEDIHEMLKIM